MSVRSVTTASSADASSLSQPATPQQAEKTTDAATPNEGSPGAVWSASDDAGSSSASNWSGFPGGGTATLNLDHLASVLGTTGDDLLTQLTRGDLSPLSMSTGSYDAQGMTATLADSVKGGLLYDDYA